MPLRPLTTADADTVARRAALAFGPGGEPDRWIPRLEAGEVLGWAAKVDGAVLAHAAVTTVEHWFGSRRVPCQHVAGVAVAPEHRGTGAARGLMEEVVQHGAAGGLGLSVLFPATTRLYRKVGFEHAGEFVRYRLAASAAPAIGPPMRASSAGDWDAIRACAERANAVHNGPAVRPDRRWDEIREASYWYVLDGEDGLDAYVLFDQERDPGDWQYRLSILDWAATTGRGLEAVVGFVGRHGTIGKEATYRGPVPDVWSQYVPELAVERVGSLWWMARGLSLPSAVAARGYPPGLAVTVTFSVADPLLPAAAGPWRLEVADGKGELSPAGDAELRVETGAVGPLFTGFRSASSLAAAGLVDGPPDAVARLGAPFAGPTPHLLDFF